MKPAIVLVSVALLGVTSQCQDKQQHKASTHGEGHHATGVEIARANTKQAQKTLEIIKSKLDELPTPSPHPFVRTPCTGDCDTWTPGKYGVPW